MSMYLLDNDDDGECDNDNVNVNDGDNNIKYIHTYPQVLCVGI